MDFQKFRGLGVERRRGREILVSLVIGEDMSLLQLSFSVCVFSLLFRVDSPEYFLEMSSLTRCSAVPDICSK